MRRLGLLALLLVAGCPRPCKDKTVLVALTLDGDTIHADELDVSVVASNETMTAKVQHASNASSGTLEIDFPRGFPAHSTIAVTVTALAHGVAIGSGKGLVVPVLRNAERMSFAEIELAIGDFAQRAKENKLKVEELQGGTFTISNGGVYGSLLSTPIVNPPQSGVLGMHAIQERPMAREGNVVIRPMMYLALTYDHRIVDGREAVMFLKRIKETIENPARMLIEV